MAESQPCDFMRNHAPVSLFLWHRQGQFTTLLLYGIAGDAVAAFAPDGGRLGFIPLKFSCSCHSRTQACTSKFSFQGGRFLFLFHCCPDCLLCGLSGCNRYKNQYSCNEPHNLQAWSVNIFSQVGNSLPMCPTSTQPAVS